MRTIGLNHAGETNSQKKQKLMNILSIVNKVDVDTDEGRSLMKIKKSRGPKILPCGTPDTTGNVVDTLPFIDTH